eukprot:1831335-Ditylum_brightwellii.AAC.1
MGTESNISIYWDEMHKEAPGEYNAGMFGESIKLGYNNGAQQHGNMFKMCKLICMVVTEGDQSIKFTASGGGQHALKTSDGNGPKLVLF